MSKPDDIPQDIWGAAIKCGKTVCRNLDYDDVTVEVTAIASVIMAERARCSALLNNGCTLEDGEPVDPAIPEIFHAINEGMQP